MCWIFNRQGSSIPTVFQAVELCKELNLTIFLEVKAFVGFGPPKVRIVMFCVAINTSTWEMGCELLGHFLVFLFAC